MESQTVSDSLMKIKNEENAVQSSYYGLCLVWLWHCLAFWDDHITVHTKLFIRPEM